jgi:hypothetical protein
MLEQLLQLLGREQVEQHQNVGLLRGLVPVRRVALGLEQPVQALDVAIARLERLPVEPPRSPRTG